MAPEIIMGEPLSFASDYWSLGIILYEMVVGVPPFYHENEEIVIELILKNEILFPSTLELSEECKDLIKGLLQSDKRKRIGAFKGYEEFNKHAWF